jgi:hypothetical protein
MPTFFLNGTTLLNSTAVFLDSEQLICAPDGYYSDGVIVREQLGCRLILTLGCPSCTSDCPIVADNIFFATQKLVYSLSTDTSFGTGAILINFNTNNIVNGIIVELNGSYYNELSSPVHGYLAAPPGLVTYIGRSDNACFCPTLPFTGCSYVVGKRNWNGTSFVSIPGTETVNITISNLELTPTGSGDCVMVIPKTSTGIQTINVYVYKICYQNNFNLEVSCVEPLPTFQASDRFDSPSDPGFCEASSTANTFYVAKVSTLFPYPTIAPLDWVFQDENGENKLADGYYKTNNLSSPPYDTILVANGVVQGIFSECP